MGSFGIEHLADFRAALIEIESEMRSSYPTISGLADLLGPVRSQQIRRHSVGVNGTQVQIHGIGCLFVQPSGAIIDVDFGPDDTVIFDSWRIKQYASSVGIGSADDREVADAISLMIENGAISQVRKGWYTFQ